MNTIFQVVAWSQMLVNYSATAGLAEGITMTFDGKHPCRLCHAVSKSRQRQADEKKEHPELSLLKLASSEFIIPGTTLTPTPRSIDFRVIDFAPIHTGNSLFGESPLLPPPRGRCA